VFPQPGLAADWRRAASSRRWATDTADWMRENYAAGVSWVDLGTFAGPDGEEALYGFFYKVDVKSLVWYAPSSSRRPATTSPRRWRS
jgi:alpha-glucoside transport system substrate-binding protein